MATLTQYRCDRCGFIESDPANLLRVEIHHSEHFDLREDQFDLCHDCEKSLVRWLKQEKDIVQGAEQPDPTDYKDSMSIRDTAKATGIPERRLRKAIELGEVKVVQPMGIVRNKYVPLAEVERLKHLYD